MIELKKYLIFKLLLILSMFISLLSIANAADLDSDVSHLNVHGGGIIKFDGTYYWYGEKRDKQGLTSQVSLYSSNDKINWKYIGVILDLSKIKPIHTIERPKIIYVNKKFVMWVHLELYGQYKSAKAGVAISDNITKPFKFTSEFWPNQGAVEEPNDNINKLEGISIEKIKNSNLDFESSKVKGQDFRDFNIYQEGTKCYVIYTSESNSSIHISNLNPECTMTTGKVFRLFVGGRNEAPVLFKMHNHYYIFTSGLKGFSQTPINMYEAGGIFGEWKYIGNPVIGSSPDNVATGFHSQPSSVFIENKNFYYIGDRWVESDLKNSSQIIKKIIFYIKPQLAR